MRYVVNDDDLEDWYVLLLEANKTLQNDKVEYVIECIEREIRGSGHAKDPDDFIKLLKGHAK